MSLTDTQLREVFDETLRLVRAALPETTLLRCAGRYDVPIDPAVGPITGVRVEQPGRPAITLASLGVAGPQPEPPLTTDDAVQHEGPPARMELTWSQPAAAAGVALGNEDTSDCHRAAGLVVSVRVPDGTWLPLLDTAARFAAWRAERIDHLRAQFADDPQVAYLNDLLLGVVVGEYGRARQGVQKQTPPVPTERIATMRLAANPDLLAPRRREWTMHGIHRSFRFWTEDEKRAYVQFATDVAHDLTSLTPNVCFGFGAALAVVRENDLIAHDDDLDLIIALEPKQAKGRRVALAKVAEHLTPLGYVVSGDFFGHCHVSSPGRGKKVDVFVAVIRDDHVSWYPTPRRPLQRSEVFPPSPGAVFGVEVPLPAQPEKYLAAQYGPDWRTPDAHFKHDWSRARFREQTRRVSEPAMAPAPAPPPPRPLVRRVLGRLRRELRRGRGH